MTFLEQLQESAGLLGNQIQNVKPFGNYDPTLASDYVGGPMGLIPQNRFVGNQFQMPFPGGQSYTPGAMAPGGYNPLPYTPLPFNQGNVSTTQPGLLTQIEQALGGGGGDGDPRRQPGGEFDAFSGKYQSFGGQMYSIDKDGNVKKVESTPLTSPFLGLLSSISGMIPGEEKRQFNALPADQQRKIAELFSKEIPNFVDQTGQPVPIARPGFLNDYAQRDGRPGPTGPAPSTQGQISDAQRRSGGRGDGNQGGGATGSGGGATGSGGGVGGQGMRGGGPGARS